MQVAEAKRSLRAAIAARRRSVGVRERDAAAASVARFVQATPEYREASRVVLYAALTDELSTRPLADAARGEGRALLLPRVGSEGRLEFVQVSGLEVLRKGTFGVLEPPPDAPAEELAPDDLALLPGVAFDPSGGRLGRGGGFFDRSLPVDRGPVLFGIGFAFQLVERVPTADHDRRVDVVVTERGILRVAAIR